jgi:hypothetical protein
MQFAYTLSENFPPLAWVATCRPDLDTTTVLHGRFVETHPHFFVEGVWAGDFEAGRLQDSDTVFGSGGCLTDESVTFASCTATTDFLYHSNDIDRFVISNSLPLLLAMLDDELNIAGKDYSRINMSILDGIHQYRPDIPTRQGHVTRIMHSNLRFGADGLTPVEKPLPPNFQQFEDYRDYMQGRIGELFANARHPARKNQMKIFSTQSKGYDSTAVNALAAPFGIDKVFTSVHSKECESFYLGGQVSQPSDDGTPICESLGLTCIAIDRLSFRENLSSEHFYWAGLDNNQDLNLHHIQSFVSTPTLLLTGQYGEFWYTRDITGENRMHYFDDALKKWDVGGHGLSEIRLKVGFIQATIPVIGSRNRNAILDITESPEMQPWRLNTPYDRPIPRRIAEEARVPREMFGQIKLASVVHLPTPNVPVTPDLRDEFFRHLIKHKLLGRMGIRLLPVVQRINNWIYWDKPIRHFNNRRKHPLLWHIGYYWWRLSGRPLRIRMLWPQLGCFLYGFCVNKVSNEAAGMLAQSCADGGVADTHMTSSRVPSKKASAAL